MEELERKIREHRKKVRLTLIVIAAAIVAFFVVLKLILAFMTYDDYKIVSSMERNDSSATAVCAFADGLLKYSNDGISYVTLDGELVWNQTFEMENPRVDICKDYVVVYDQGETQLYILDTTEIKGGLKSSNAIMQVHVSETGNVAVLTEDGSACDIQMYDETGAAIAKGRVHIENSGYPMDIALSDDGIKLAVAMLDVTSGSIKTSIGFYNFGSVGQNEIDNIVGTFSYSGSMIPRIEFVTNDKLFAFGDNLLVVFEGTQRLEETAQIPVSDEIKSIFYNSEYLGIITDNASYFAEGTTRATEGDASAEAVEWSEKENGRYRMTLYNSKGKTELSRAFDADYESVSFLSNGEICLLGEVESVIFTTSGKKKFSYSFEKMPDAILSGKTSVSYTFVFDDEIDKVRLK